MIALRPCAYCGVPTRRAGPTPICHSDMAQAEAIFRRTHSPRDPDWVPARNRTFGKGMSILALLRAHEVTV